MIAFLPPGRLTPNRLQFQFFLWYFACKDYVFLNVICAIILHQNLSGAIFIYYILTNSLPRLHSVKCREENVSYDGFDIVPQRLLSITNVQLPVDWFQCATKKGRLNRNLLHMKNIIFSAIVRYPLNIS